jgi:rare lipoprotein A
MQTFSTSMLVAASLAAAAATFAVRAEPSTPAGSDTTHSTAPALDRSGKARHGKASWYGRGFVGKPMADGTPMDPHANNAASRTLPLGTTAKVTNLDNGKSAVVEIRDRGPYVDGRIVDVSPRTAAELGLTHRGVAPVEVAPIEVPQVDGSVKPGVAAADAGPQQATSD